MLKLFETGGVNLGTITYGGRSSFLVEGTPDGATIKLRTRRFKDTWIDLVSTTTVGIFDVDIPPDVLIRTEVNGGTSPNVVLSIGGKQVAGG